MSRSRHGSKLAWYRAMVEDLCPDGLFRSAEGEVEFETELHAEYKKDDTGKAIEAFRHPEDRGNQLSWEQGYKGTQVDLSPPPDQQRSLTSASTAGSAAARLPEEKSHHSLHRLGVPQERAFKEYLREVPNVTYMEWMASIVLNGREKRCHTHAWTRRQEKAVLTHMHIDEVLSALPNFTNEKPAMQHFESCGHMLLLLPKFHAEVAGVGIEYSWGMSKWKFRREVNDEVSKRLYRNMVVSVCTEQILTVQRVRRFARRTRDYGRAYLELQRGDDIESKDMIEKMKKCKSDHNILDMEPGFIDTQYE